MVHGDEHVLVGDPFSDGILDADDSGAAAGVGDLGAGESGGEGGEKGGVEVWSKFHVFGVMIEEGLAAGFVG